MQENSWGRLRDSHPDARAHIFLYFCTFFGVKWEMSSWEIWKSDIFREQHGHGAAISPKHVVVYRATRQDVAQEMEIN